MRHIILSLSFLISSVALARSWQCTLDDCVLPNHLHQLEASPVDGYTWMLHDLALARQALREGDRSRAGQIANSLHFTLERQSRRIVAADGEDFVQAMHTELAEILDASGFVSPSPLY